MTRPQAGDLSARQRQVVELVAMGMDSKEIAAEMGIGTATVATYKKTIRERYEGQGRPAGNGVLLMWRAIEDGIIDAPRARTADQT